MKIRVPAGMQRAFSEDGKFLGLVPLDTEPHYEAALPLATPQNPFRSPSYIAEALDVKSYTVREWLRDGKIKGHLINGQWKVLHSDFVAFLQERFGPDGKG